MQNIAIHKLKTVRVYKEGKEIKQFKCDVVDITRDFVIFDGIPRKDKPGKKTRTMIAEPHTTVLDNTSNTCELFLLNSAVWITITW